VISAGVGLRGAHLVPLYPETYAMTFPRGEIVRLRARAFTPLISEVRDCEDGVKPIKLEAKCDWAKSGSNSLCKSPCSALLKRDVQPIFAD
jgi:hypothetical protein